MKDAPSDGSETTDQQKDRTYQTCTYLGFILNEEALRSESGGEKI